MDRTFFAVEIDGLEVAQEFSSDQKVSLQLSTETLNASYWYYPAGYYYISHDMPGVRFVNGDPLHSGQLIIRPVGTAFYWPLEITQHGLFPAALARNLEKEEAVIRWIAERHPNMDHELFSTFFQRKYQQSHIIHPSMLLRKQLEPVLGRVPS